MSVRILVGDALAMLKTLPSESVQMCVTSPPFYGLRAYGTTPQVWGGTAECEHAWGEYVRPGQSGGTASAKVQIKGQENFQIVPPQQQAFCLRCNAWRGELGSEPTPALFIEHLVAIFREVRRVLRKDATLWLNLGDSYAGSGKGPTGHNGIGDQGQRQGFTDHRTVGNLPPKSLLMIPFRVAMALQADGWILRSVIPWLKRNAMPESVTDRPATAVEYLFLFSKARSYFWDAEAIRHPADPDSFRETKNSRRDSRSDFGQSFRHVAPSHPTANGKIETNPSGRSRRNSDWFFESWQGLMLDEGGDPLALLVNPAPLKESHYASFAPKLVEPFIKAGTSERGACSECLAPWRRLVEREASAPQRENYAAATAGALLNNHRGTIERPGGFYPKGATAGGWTRTCPHDVEPVPCVVLDPFLGSGTTALVADRLGRDCIGIELSAKYAVLAEHRLRQDAPMFAEIEVTA